MLHILQTTEHQDLHKCLQLLILSLVNVANVCTWLVTCNDLGNDPTYVETPPPRSENVQRICRIKGGVPGTDAPKIQALPELG